VEREFRGGKRKGKGGTSERGLDEKKGGVMGNYGQINIVSEGA